MDKRKIPRIIEINNYHIDSKTMRKSNSNPVNYRPIALKIYLCRTMERMVNKRLIWLLESNCLIAKLLCGLRTNRSTVQLENYIRESSSSHHLVVPSARISLTLSLNTPTYRSSLPVGHLGYTPYLTELLYVGSSWPPCFCTAMKGSIGVHHL